MCLGVGAQPSIAERQVACTAVGWGTGEAACTGKSLPRQIGGDDGSRPVEYHDVGGQDYRATPAEDRSCGMPATHAIRRPSPGQYYWAYLLGGGECRPIRICNYLIGICYQSPGIGFAKPERQHRSRLERDNFRLGLMIVRLDWRGRRRFALTNGYSRSNSGSHTISPICALRHPRSRAGRTSRPSCERRLTIYAGSCSR